MKRHLTLAIVIALSVFLALPAGTALAQAPAARIQAAAKPADGPQEGIKVHGDWTLVIRNEDGSVASRHEFRNSLNPFGVARFTRALAHQATIGRWQVRITVQDPPPAPSGTNTRSLTIVEPSLQVDAPQTAPDVGSLVLTGSIGRLQAPAQVLFVSTLYEECPPTTAPSNLCAGGPIGFTDRAYSLDIAQGQSIDVTVKIFFSS